MARKPVQPLPKALAKVNDASVSVDDWITSVGDDTPALTEIFGTLDDTIHILLQVRDIVKAAILRRSHWSKDPEAPGWVMDDGQRFPYLLPGGGYLMRRGGKQATRYDQGNVVADLAKGIAAEIVEQDLAARAMDSEGTIVPIDRLVFRACELMAAAAGATAPSFTAWRSGITKKLGVDLKRHADETKTTEVTLSVEGRRAG